MIILKILGWIWTLPHTLFGVLCLLTVYFPKSIRWSDGALDVVVRWNLIPKGFDRTGDGDVDDPKDFKTGAQTHGFIIFYRDERTSRRESLRCHERVHVVQCMVLGGVLSANFLTLVVLPALYRAFGRRGGREQGVESQ